MTEITKAKAKKRGFTTAEKWIIWGVFCLIVGLSSYRLSVFLGLMALSSGISLVHGKRNLVAGLVLSTLGVLSLIFSKYLI